MNRLIRALAMALALAFASSSLIGCFRVISKAKDDEFTIPSGEVTSPLHVTENDAMISTNPSFQESAWYHVWALNQPLCGKVTNLKKMGYIVDKMDNVAFQYDRSSGVESGSYSFYYTLSVVDEEAILEPHVQTSARVTVNLTDSYPSPDGSPPCSAPYQAFIDGANAAGGAISLRWSIPDGVRVADSYTAVAYNQQNGVELGAATLGASAKGSQTGQIPISSPAPVMMVTLNTHRGAKIVFSDTLRGVSGSFPEFVVVDDHVELIQGSIESATVDVLANDYAPVKSRSGAKPDWALSIVNPGGVSATVTSGPQVTVDAQNSQPGQYMVTIETTLPGANPQRQYLYVDYMEQGKVPPTVENDSFTGFAGEPLSMPVLANDSAYYGGPLTITGFSQPGGGATVTKSGDMLVISSPTTGTYGFDYTAQDEFGNSATANVTVKLIKKEEAPAPAPAPVDCVADPFNPAC